jgi:hypothetical protein
MEPSVKNFFLSEGLGGEAQWSGHHDHLDFAFMVPEGTQLYAVKMRDLSHLRQRITACCAAVHPNILSRNITNLVKWLGQCAVSG